MCSYSFFFLLFFPFPFLWRGKALMERRPAGSKENTVEPYRVSRKGDAGFLQDYVDAAAERAGESAGRADRASGAEEGGVEAFEGSCVVFGIYLGGGRRDCWR